MSAGADIAAVMEPLDRMETLSRRLALHHRLIGDALEEASEIPAAANLDAVKDGLDIWVLQQEQLRELDKLVQDAHVADDAAGVLAQVVAALGYCIANDRDAEVALAAGDFDALVEGDLDFPAKILAQALRGLRNLSARETGA